MDDITSIDDEFTSVKSIGGGYEDGEISELSDVEQTPFTMVSLDPQRGTLEFSETEIVDIAPMDPKDEFLPADDIKPISSPRSSSISMDEPPAAQRSLDEPPPPPPMDGPPPPPQANEASKKHHAPPPPPGKGAPPPPQFFSFLQTSETITVHKDSIEKDEEKKEKDREKDKEKQKQKDSKDRESQRAKKDEKKSDFDESIFLYSSFISFVWIFF